MRIVAIAMLVAGLAACIVIERTAAPRYRVEHLYTPPSTEEGLRCVAACEKRQGECRVAAKQDIAGDHRRCQDQAGDDYDACRGGTTSMSEKQQCYRKACPVSADYVNCEGGFQGCFQKCGGQIWNRTVCEANC